MAYFDNPQMLARHYEQFRQMPHEVSKRMAVIIVDDGSPDYPAWGEYIGMKLSVYRVGVNVRWNQDACRNIGVHHAETQWVLLTDMDHMLPVKTAEYLVNNKFDGRMAYKFTRVSEPDMSFYKSHPNSWFLTKALYDKVGGYDERFAGFYGTDFDIRDRLAAQARILCFDEKHLIRVPREITPDAATPKEFGRKSDSDGINIKRIKAERAAEPGWTTKRLTFPYVQVYG